MAGKAAINCAFCQGKGLDPFGLLSPISKCQACGGTGKVEVEEPMIKCAFCMATGVYPHNARVTCTVCNGKGSITIKGATDECPKCKGTGRAIDSGLPCIKCGGKGVVKKNSHKQRSVLKKIELCRPKISGLHKSSAHWR